MYDSCQLFQVAHGVPVRSPEKVTQDNLPLWNTRLRGYTARALAIILPGSPFEHIPLLTLLRELGLHDHILVVLHE